jgi:hypothetical protein
MREDPELRSPGERPNLDFRMFQSHKVAINRGAPHSITRLVLCAVLDANCAAGFRYQPVIGTLELRLSAANLPRFSRSRRRQAALQEYESVHVQDQFFQGTSDEEICEAAAAFAGLQTSARADWRSAWEQLGERPPRRMTDARVLGYAQFDTLTPFAKTCFTSGAGEVVLKRALIEPLSAAKAARKDAFHIDREELVHAWWLNSWEDPGDRFPPPFILN